MCSLIIWFFQFQFSSVTQSCLTLCDPNELQHARPPCPSPTPRVYSDSCPSSRWCHPAITSSVVPFSSCPQSLPASGSFPINQLFASGGQSIGVSALASVLPMNTQDWSISFRMDWLDLLAVQGTLKSLLQHPSSKESIFRHSAFFTVQLSHPYMTTGKTIALTRWTFVDKVISLLFNMLSRLGITFLPRRKRLLISWLQSSSAVIWFFRGLLIHPGINLRLIPLNDTLSLYLYVVLAIWYPHWSIFLGLNLMKPSTPLLKWKLYDLNLTISTGGI